MTSFPQKVSEYRIAPGSGWLVYGRNQSEQAEYTQKTPERRKWLTQHEDELPVRVSPLPRGLGRRRAGG